MCVCNTCNDYSIFPARNPGGMVALVFQTGPNRLHQQTKAVRDQTSPVLVTSGVLNEHIIQIRQRVEHDKALFDAIHNGFPWQSQIPPIAFQNKVVDPIINPRQCSTGTTQLKT